MADLSTSVDEICSIDDSEDGVTARLQDIFREKAELAGLTRNVANIHIVRTLHFRV